MLYRVPAETMLRRVSYHGGLPFACPLALDVRGEGGATVRATYVDGSMLERPGARYLIEGEVYELGRDGVLRPVASEGRKAA